MQKKKRSIYRYIISFLITIVFLYIAFSGVKFFDLWESLKNANYWWVALLIPLNILGNWVRAVRWADLLYPIKPNISKRNLFSGVMIGYAINNVLPRVGEFVRPYVLGKLENISKTAAFGTVVVERILDFMSFYFIVCIVLFISPKSLDPFVANPESVRPYFLFGSIATLLVFVFLFLKGESFLRLLARIVHFIPKKYGEKIEKVLEKFYTGFAIAKLGNKFFKILSYSFIIWGLYALGMYIPFFAFSSLVRPDLDFGAAVILLVISSIAWVLPAPGALGTYHSFLTVAMVRLYNVDATTALSYAILTHGVNYIIATVLGAYYYFRDHMKLEELTLGSTE